ncbi:MAG: transposase [Acidobacteria bacterium]|nr:transposase [Acidobacteriota bacterium]
MKTTDLDYTSSRDWKTERRKQAIELYNKGYNQPQIARILGVTQPCVSLWITKSNKFGLNVLETKHSTGTPAKLSDKNKEELLEILKLPPTNFGFRTNFWLRKQVVEIIKEKFNVSYHPSQVSRILKKLGWTNK